MLKTLISVLRLLPKWIRVNFAVKYSHVHKVLSKSLQIAQTLEAFANMVKYDIFKRYSEEN